MSSIYTVLGFLRRHKYSVVVAFFLVVVGMVDENSLWERYKCRQEIARLKSEMREFRNRYEEDSRKLEELESNPEAVVRVAREQYLMKYPDEDVYVFVDEAPEKSDETPEDEETV
ncbi:MAG: septum formation initiator family protein [Bacteroidaceae bacterium]|nr:septum formation initiator family protein [Bacteroidaceae bacterium]